ncbi:2,3-bisphosphoglycerate-independent phosphoglycerate mutase [Heliobacillus mobilis]|uniref:2,3-bisphosphoglycerate-independent phosphoglycerate mutase n=1 Tax=Heliobacterium mobile TaxID=28064 RepID=A0A6I3SMI7_HELMO|nr:2,3-bisphosphoglycerate-independent phosphoglycerate mutase [Heliobacterium mobile]MTV50190.1 2,3-bisphosphoglycerate-independent phosphoglycerate mutase [Heliobacterium mobile]
MTDKKRPVALIILDGWGQRDEKTGNAITMARTPNMDHWMKEYPSTTLACSGEAVGLPEGQMGNSEVGHLNMGAGRVVYQELTRITKSIKEGDFFENPALLAAVRKVKAQGKSLHVMGLLSDGGVHSHINHLIAVLELARRQGLKQVYVHAFLDGRDVPPSSAGEYLIKVLAQMDALDLGIIATISGRYYAMDRDNRWERVEKAYRAMVRGEGRKAVSPSEAIELAYQAGETDEFVQPTVIIDNQGCPISVVNDGDAVVFINFRPDRARQITRAFVDKDFAGFDRGEGKPIVDLVCMTEYDKTIEAPVAFPPSTMANTLGEWLSKQGLQQLRVAETEKYAHVTFFFNGGVEAQYPGEDRVLIASPKVATYDLLPEMSAPAVTEALLERLAIGDKDLYILNFANADMVGHTGIIEAARQAVETVDASLDRIVEAIRQQSGTVVITADHGNAEKMVDEQGGPFTAHTTSPVPFILIDDQRKSATLRHDGSLQDIAPTLLALLGLPKPVEMTGTSLIQVD